jgi:hypothetical protein
LPCGQHAPVHKPIIPLTKGRFFNRPFLLVLTFCQAIDISKIRTNLTVHFIDKIIGPTKNMRITDSLREHLAEKNIKLIEESTPKAIETFNRLFKEGRRVSGGFHVGC